MLQKRFIHIMSLIILLSLTLTTGIGAVTKSPFFLHYNLVLPETLGSGVGGEMVLALINTSANTVKDIIIRLPKNTQFLFGPNNQCQAGTLNPGEQTVIQEHLFDPHGISKTGSLSFIIDYTDPAGNRQTAEITAVGNVEVAHE